MQSRFKAPTIASPKQGAPNPHHGPLFFARSLNNSRSSLHSVSELRSLMLFDKILPQRREKVDLNLWVDLYYDAVWSFCNRRVGPELASDATQETFTTAWQKMNAYRTEVAPKTWLFGIAIRHCANLQRKHRPESPLESRCPNRASLRVRRRRASRPFPPAAAGAR